MSKLDKVLKSAAGNAAGDAQNVEDVFSTYLYEGDDSTNNPIVNGIDLAGEGGMVWIKARSSGTLGHCLFDTERGVQKYLQTNRTYAEKNEGDGDSTNGLNAFNSNGFSLGQNWYGQANTASTSYASWTFRKAPRFFDVVTYTGNGTAGREIAHDLGVAPGMIIVKKTSGSAQWPVYHSARGIGKELFLNSTAAETAYGDLWSGVTSTNFTISANNQVNYSGDSYVAYLFAHDPDGENDDGMIACGSYTPNGSSGEGGVDVNLGWEPQFLLVKKSSAAAPWYMVDTMRGMPNTMTSNLTKFFSPDTSNEESGMGGAGFWPLANGFKVATGEPDLNSSGSYIYMAIRAPMMKKPGSGTDVFAISTRDATAPGHNSGFVVDAALRGDVGAASRRMFSRLTGTGQLATDATSIEGVDGNSIFDYMDGWYGAGAQATQYSWMFKRAKGFFDVVAYTGNGTAGRTVNHSLGVVPEMMWVKQRDTQAAYWITYDKPSTAYKHMMLNYDNSSASSIDHWHNTEPSGSSFTLGNGNYGNGNGRGYISYLFATLDGVSKVGSYTGNGSNQNIACGFSAGARFVLIKRTDSSGDWFTWDTTRGIVAGNDPHLSLNSTSAEVTNDDSIDPQSAGFTVNQVSATNINVSSGTYIFLAIA